MYFSIGQIKNDRAAQIAVIAAQEFGDRLVLGDGAHIPFETVVCTLKEKLQSDTTMVAAKLLIQDEDKKKSALKVGFAEIVRTFGGEDAAMHFFRQITTPRTMLRFESVGGVQDDIHAAKNRSAAMAAMAAVERYRNPKHDGFTPAEREYIDFLKSVRRSLGAAADNGVVQPILAKTLITEIEEAACTDQRPTIRDKIYALQLAASSELFSETRSQLIQQYASALRGAEHPAEQESGPTLH